MSLDNVLKIIETVASVLMALSIIIALRSYLYNRNRDNCIAAVDQITFFRKEIIPENIELIDVIKKRLGDNYIFSKIKLDEPTIKHISKNFPVEYSKQAVLMKDYEIETKQILVLNMLEELSRKIIIFKLIKHATLDCIKSPFIDMIEKNAVELLEQREINTGATTYSAILQIYQEWKIMIDRRTPEDRRIELVKELSNGKID